MKLKLIILPLCLIVLNAFGFEGTVKQLIKNYNHTGIDITVTWYLSPRSCRMDMVQSGKDINTNSVLLLDPASQTLKTYNTGGSGEKVYFQTSASDISASMPVTVNATQETKQINGYKCEKWVVMTAAGAFNVWITRDIDFDWSAYKSFFKASMEAQALASQGVKGFPMLTESAGGDKIASVETVTVQSLGADTFTVPSGYTLYVAPAQPAPAAKTK